LYHRDLFYKKGLSSSEWITYLKMIPNVTANRSNPGKSQNGAHCRRCSEKYETLPHILGFCSFGLLLRNSRHHQIRTILANAFRSKHMKTYEEVHCLANNGSNRRIDILTYCDKSSKAYIVDPTIRFETNPDQPNEVNKEKQDIYQDCIPYLQKTYKIKYPIEVVGLLIGARGTISLSTQNSIKRLNLPKNIENLIALAVEGSAYILQNHLFSS